MIASCRRAASAESFRLTWVAIQGYSFVLKNLIFYYVFLSGEKKIYCNSFILILDFRATLRDVSSGLREKAWKMFYKIA